MQRQRPAVAFRVLVRLIAALALVFVNLHLAALTAFDCCAVSAVVGAGDEHGCCGPDSGVESESDGHCPLPCPANCSGHGVRALVVGTAPVVAPPMPELVTDDRRPEQRPVAPDRPGILRVPKSLRAQA